jgi:hypothetical protein
MGNANYALSRPGRAVICGAVWGTFMSPKASRPVVDPVRLLIELAVFGSGVAALFAADATALALACAVLVVMHLALTFALGQRPERDAVAAPPS